MRVFSDRHDAGAQLARALHGYAEADDIIVLAHTRTSVPVAYEIAMRLALPLDLVGASAELVIDVSDKVVVLVDDGAATRQMPQTIEELRWTGGRAVIAATAVASPHVFALLQAAADRTVCLLTPQHIYSIEAWYADLTEPSSDEIHQLLVAAAQNVLGLRRGKFLIGNIDT